MARIAFQQINQLPDILDQAGFELLLGNVPGAGDTRDLTLKCQTAAIPGFSNETWEAALHGHVRKFRGRKMYSRQLSVTFYEDSLFNTYGKLLSWHENIANTESGNSSGFQHDYSVNAELVVYNTIGAAAARITFDNLFISEISDATLDGSSSAGVSIPAMFSFDRMSLDGVTIL